MKHSRSLVLATIAGYASAAFWPLEVVNPLASLFGLDIDTIESTNNRLLEFGSGERSYHSETEIMDLIRGNVNFMDVTAHPDAQWVQASSEVNFPKKVFYYDEVHSLAGNLSESNLETVVSKFSSFWNRYARGEHGLTSSLWLADKIDEIASIRDDVSVEIVDHEWLQKSIIARFEGYDNKDHVVVVGAHLDSINSTSPELRAPGADDNGSGTSTILEVFRVLVESGYTPRNTLEFHWYSAEELGLLGSQDIFAKYSEDKVDVKAMLQQDCTGYSAASKAGGNPDKLGVVVDLVDPGLTNYIKLIVDSYLDIGYEDTTCGYGCSDHASASKYGYPASFVLEAGKGKVHPHMHTIEDTIDKLDFTHMREHAKLTLGYAFELGLADL